MRRVGLVLAGGAGRRLWPWSTPDRPKQFLTELLPSGLPSVLAAVEFLHTHGRAADVAVSADVRHIHLAEQAVADCRLRPVLMCETGAGGTAWAHALAAWALPADCCIVSAPVDVVFADPVAAAAAINRLVADAVARNTVALLVSPAVVDGNAGRLRLAPGRKRTVKAFWYGAGTSTPYDRHMRTNTGLAAGTPTAWRQLIGRANPALYIKSRAAVGVGGRLLEGARAVVYDSRDAFSVAPPGSVDDLVYAPVAERLRAVEVSSQWWDVGTFNGLISYRASVGTAVTSSINERAWAAPAIIADPDQGLLLALGAAGARLVADGAPLDLPDHARADDERVSAGAHGVTQIIVESAGGAVVRVLLFPGCCVEIVQAETDLPQSVRGAVLTGDVSVSFYSGTAPRGEPLVINYSEGTGFECRRGRVTVVENTSRVVASLVIVSLLEYQGGAVGRRPVTLTNSGARMVF